MKINQKKLAEFIALLSIVISMASILISSFSGTGLKWNSIEGEPGFKEYNQARQIVLSGESYQLGQK